MVDTPAIANPIFPPDRKVWAGGLSGVITAGLAWGAKKWLGWDIPPELLTLVPVLVGYIVSYLVPPTVKDVIKRVDDTVIAIARASDASDASPKEPPMTPAVAAKVNEAIATGKA